MSGLGGEDRPILHEKVLEFSSVFIAFLPQYNSSFSHVVLVNGRRSCGYK